MNDVAKAIQFVQTSTGCRVALIPMEVQGKGDNGILKASVSAQVEAEVAGAGKSKASQNALKSVSDTVATPAKKPRKATRAIKEKVTTYMTVPKFAELHGCAVSAVYQAIRRGNIDPKMVDRTNGCILIDSRAESQRKNSKHNRAGIKVFCKETKMAFDSIAQACKATGLYYEGIKKSIIHGTACKGMTFTLFEPTHESR